MKQMKREHLNIAMFGQQGCSRSGGIEVVVTELTIRMADLGHHVVCYNRSSALLPLTKKRNILFGREKAEERLVPTVNRKGLAAVTSSFFAALAAGVGPYDIVHVHAEGPAVMCWLPRLLGKKVICTIHGLDYDREKWKGIAKIYIRLGELCAVKFSNAIIVLSKNNHRYFLKRYGKKTVYIPNGTSCPVIKEAKVIQERFHLEKDSYILFLARIVPEKGLRYLIKAYKKLETNKKLVIAGDSSDTEDFKKELEKMAQGDPRILFTGFVQGEVLEELFSNAYIFVLPSDLEGMSLSLLEAMSYGNCCLTSDIPECTEVIEDHALTFRKSDVEDLREKLQRLCDDPELVLKFREGTSDYICKKYNWDDVTVRTLSLYRKVLKAGR